MKTLPAYAKALVAAATSALSFLIPVVDDGLTTSEGLGGVLAFLVGLGVTYAVPNRPEPHERRTVSR